MWIWDWLYYITQHTRCITIEIIAYWTLLCNWLNISYVSAFIWIVILAATIGFGREGGRRETSSCIFFYTKKECDDYCWAWSWPLYLPADDHPPHTLSMTLSVSTWLNHKTSLSITTVIKTSPSVKSRNGFINYQFN